MSTKSTIYFSWLEQGGVHLYCEGNDNFAVYLDAAWLGSPFRICSWEAFIAGLDARLSLDIAGVLRDRRAALAPRG